MAEIAFRQAREMAQLSQRELDRRAGVPYGTTFDLETGRTVRPAYETVVRIVRALQRAGLRGLTAEALFPVPDDKEAIAS